MISACQHYETITVQTMTLSLLITDLFIWPVQDKFDEILYWKVFVQKY